MSEIFTDYVENIKGYKVVKLQNVKRLSGELDISIREVEIELLNKGIVPYRYIQNIRFFGVDGQIKLLRSTAAIAGCGGLGGCMAELCARLGIGKLILVDGDKFDESNLNRQLFSTEDYIGMYKVEMAKERINKVNSGVEVTAHKVFLGRNNVKDIIKGSCCVIDGLDNIEARFILQNACRETGIPMVHGAIGDASIHVASIVPGDNTLNNIYSPQIQKNTINCGSPAASVFLCASLEVGEALKILLQRGEVLQNKLLHYDWLYNEFNIFNF